MRALHRLACGVMVLLLAPVAQADSLWLHMDPHGSGFVTPVPVPEEVHQDIPVSSGLLQSGSKVVFWLPSEDFGYQDGVPHGTGYGLGYEIATPSASTLVWYLSTPADALGLQDAQVQVAVLDDMLGDSDPIASGQSEPRRLAPGDADATVAGRAVYRLEIPVTWHEAIPMEGFMLEVITTVGPPQTPRADVALHSSLGHRPHLLLSVDAPIRFEWVQPQVVNGTFLLHVAAQTPWGPIGIQNVEAEATMAGQTVPFRHIGWEPRFHCHCPLEPRTDTFVVENATKLPEWTVAYTDYSGNVATATVQFAEDEAIISFNGEEVRGAAPALSNDAPAVAGLWCLLLPLAALARRGRADS